MLRLTGGIFRGQGIQAPKNSGTRPTQAKLRQALFNSLQLYLQDAKVLDLFAGSGALGFEALSRGAQEVVFVEESRTVVKLIEKNSDLLGVREKVHLLGMSVDQAVPKILKSAPFDIVLADPPYQEGWEMKLLTQLPWNELLAEGGRFCLEWGVQKSAVSELPAELPYLEKVREKTYGDSILTTYLRRRES